MDRKFLLLNNVTILNYLNAPEEFLKREGKCVLLLVFIFIQQINDNLLEENICGNLYLLVEKLLKITCNFFKEEVNDYFIKDFDISITHFKKFLDKVKKYFFYLIENLLFRFRILKNQQNL